MFRYLDFGAYLISFAKAADFSNIMGNTYAGEKFVLATAGVMPNFCASISEALTPVAWGMLMIYFCIELMQKTAMDNFNFQQMIGPFIKLIVGVVVISKCQNMTTGLANMTNGLTQIASSAIGGAGLANEAIAGLEGSMFGIFDEYLKDTSEISASSGSFTTDDLKIGLVSGFALLFKLFPYILVAQILKLFIWFMSFARQIEFFARASLLPIACADLSSGGLHSGGARYIKKILAVGAQGVILTAILAAGQSLMLESIGTVATQADVKFLVISVVLIGALGSSKRVADDVFGV